MSFQPVILWSDALIYLLVLSVIIFVLYARKRAHIRRAWQYVGQTRLGVVSIGILSVYVAIGLLDSIHYRVAVTQEGETAYYSARIYSLLDQVVSPLGQQYETTYSAPFALHLYSKESVVHLDGSRTWELPRLQHAAQNIVDKQERARDITRRLLLGIGLGSVLWLGLILACLLYKRRRGRIPLRTYAIKLWQQQQGVPWRTVWLMSWLIVVVLSCLWLLASNYHVFGTDKVGQDVFYQAIKSIRTGLAIGTLTTLIILPFALLLGIMAGYFSGWIDDVVQYIYTTLSSIPSVLLIAAAILSLQVYIMNHPQQFQNLAHQADIRLLALCGILGITSWTSLCRLLRAETLKLREADYVQAAIALGSSRRKILSSHILPNVMHIVLITVIIDFSILVLAEGVLSYVGVGVDPTTMSWGNMINSARLELARDPVVWWPITAAFIFMFTLVLAANFFADVVRDAFDPRVAHSIPAQIIKPA